MHQFGFSVRRINCAQCYMLHLCNIFINQIMKREMPEINVSKNQGSFDKETRETKIQNDVCKALDLGFLLRLILMQNDGIKIVEEMIKVIRKMKSSTFTVKKKIDFYVEFFKNNLIMTMSQQLLAQLEADELIHEKKWNQENNNQNFRQQLIEKVVEQLYNARQNVLKLQQTDSTNNLSNSEQIKNDPQNEIQQYFSSFAKKENQNANTQTVQLKKALSSVETDSKQLKKSLEQAQKSISQKQQKITSLKNTIVKLEEHIIRQVKLQGDIQMKTSVNQATTAHQLDKNQNFNNRNKISNQPNNLIKSEALEREVVELKKQIEILKNDLSKSTQILSQKNTQLMKYSMKLGLNIQLQKQKQMQFLALSRQYAKVKQEVSIIINESKLSSGKQIDNVVSGQEYDEQCDNKNMLKAELQIVNQKYKKLEIAYAELKKKFQVFTNQYSTQIPIIKKTSQLSIPSNQQLNIGEAEEKRRSKSRAKTKQLKYSSTSKKVVDDPESDQEQMLRQMKEMSRVEKLDQSTSITSFQNLVNPTEMTSKIKGFDYNNSIIHKVSSSKFINTFQAKVSFILQYTCLLQLYFTKGFLSGLREQLMMENTIILKPISNEQMNQQYYIAAEQPIHDSSFSSGINNNLSKISSSSNKMFINNQFSINEYSNINRNQSKTTSNELSQSITSLPNPQTNSSFKSSDKKAKFDKLQEQLKQILALFPNQFLTAQELRDDPQFLARVQKIKHNSIAQIVANLLKQNEVFKKCLNQMIKNEQSFTKLNNDIYFDDDGQLRRRSSSTTSIKSLGASEYKKDKDKDNCLIM